MSRLCISFTHTHNHFTFFFLSHFLIENAQLLNQSYSFFSIRPYRIPCALPGVNELGEYHFLLIVNLLMHILRKDHAVGQNSTAFICAAATRPTLDGTVKWAVAKKPRCVCVMDKQFTGCLCCGLY
ncbi:hypothetical protein CSKR_203557 [Clonorchis sinensis]|uniref:Uncharacterized protein n=1 Tax=Clonorchis sinensis TaxID=79923 RepID=A0A8T1MCC2_CLOSI|nr:hypothetical protein CSKR_203557 [Clonorchis sinensis]